MGQNLTGIKIEEKRIINMKMQHKHVAEVAHIYSLLFTGFLSDLGKKWLQLYISEFCKHDYDFAVVAVEKDSRKSRVIGFIIGSTNVSMHNKYFLFNHFFSLIAIFIYKFLTTKTIRMSVMEKETRKKFFRICLNISKLYLKKRPIRDGNGGKSVYVMFTAVCNGFLGTGVAENLFRYFEGIIGDFGIMEGKLRVHSDNKRATRFYKKMGWRPDPDSEASMMNSKWLYYVKSPLDDYPVSNNSLA